MAILDKTGCGGHRLHGRFGLHVRTVQGLRSAVAQAEGLQPRDLCAELPRHGQEAGEELLLHGEHGCQGRRGSACLTNGDQRTATFRGRPPRSHTCVMGPAGSVSPEYRLALGHYKWQKWSWVSHPHYLLSSFWLICPFFAQKERRRNTKWSGSHEAVSSVKRKCEKLAGEWFVRQGPLEQGCFQAMRRDYWTDPWVFTVTGQGQEYGLEFATCLSSRALNSLIWKWQTHLVLSLKLSALSLRHIRSKLRRCIFWYSYFDS